MQSKRGDFVVILVMLIGFGLFMVLGIAGKFLNTEDKKDKVVDDNVNKEFLFKGKLYFYDNDVLLGTYSCGEGYVYCGYGYEYLDDAEYKLDYYDDEKIDLLGVINKRYVFISDSKNNDEYYRKDGILLYDLKTGNVIINYEAVKNYGIGINNNLYIAKKNGKWGAIVIGDVPSSALEFKYDYIGLKGIVKDGKIDNTDIVVMNEGIWSIMDYQGNKKSYNFSNSIVDFNGKNVVLSNGIDKEKLYSYSGEELLNGTEHDKVVLLGDYVGIYNSGNFFIVDPKDNETKSETYDYEDIKDIECEEENGKIIIKKNGNILEEVNG